jgi:hypothetical protein
MWQHFHAVRREPHMHWILLLIAVVGFAGGIFAPTQGLTVIGLVIGFAGLFGGFIALVSARIAERSRPDSILLSDADVNALRKSVRDARIAREHAAARGAGPPDPPR